MVSSRKLEGAKSSGQVALTTALALSAAGTSPWVTLAVSFISAIPGIIQIAGQTYLDNKAVAARLQPVVDGMSDLDEFRDQVDSKAGKIKSYKPSEQ